MFTRFTRIFKSSLLLAAVCLPLSGQTIDTTGTAQLSGPYFYRYVAFLTDYSTGVLFESCSVTGVMTFDGRGSYSTSSTQLYDSAGSNGSCSAPTTGTYGVQSNGIAQFDNPIFPASLLGTFTAPVVSASSTEEGYEDFFVAIQASSNAVATSALSGSYTAGTMDFLNASLSYARQGYFTFTANNGTIPAFSVTGSAYNLGSSSLTQSLSGGSYSLTGNGTGTLSFTSPTGATVQSQLISGSKALFLSADGNYILGGSTSGTDMIFGFKSSSGASSNASLYGTYFTAGMDATLSSPSNPFLDAFYGAITTNGDGNQYWHERFDDIYDGITYDYTFNNTVMINSSGTDFGLTYTTLVGNNGNAFLFMGSGRQFSMNIGVKAIPNVPVTSMYINPLGIVNAASYTPITTSYAPGELVSIFGQFSGVATAGISSLPVATTLGGVRVMVNGMAAPVFYVSATQITAMIPYEVSGSSFATFQVVANGTTSNPVTVYVDLTAPGVYTAGQNGLGAGAVLHTNFTPVNSSSPAQPGETLLLYLNGLGTVAPAVADGAAAPATPLSNFNGDLSLFLDDTVGNEVDPAIQFAGLAPGFAGLYQINFTLPKQGLQNGNVSLAIVTDEATTEMAQIAVSNFPHTSTANVSPIKSHRK